MGRWLQRSLHWNVTLFTFQDLYKGNHLINLQDLSSKGVIVSKFVRLLLLQPCLKYKSPSLTHSFHFKQVIVKNLPHDFSFKTCLPACLRSLLFPIKISPNNDQSCLWSSFWESPEWKRIYYGESYTCSWGMFISCTR